MIGFLKGKVALKDVPYIYIDVCGVGYKVLVPNNILSFVEEGKEITVFTYTYVREDAFELFGFLEHRDLKLFEQLISVSGVGPKTAVNIFSFGTGDKIVQAISAGDVSFFTSVPRLGKKNAQKIIIDLKGKLGGSELCVSDITDNSNNEVISALKSIGFTVKEAQDAIRNIKDPQATVEEKIKKALKYLGK